MRAVEESYREAFVSEPGSMVEAWRQGKLLLNVFSPEVLPTFVYEVGTHKADRSACQCCFMGSLLMRCKYTLCLWFLAVPDG